MNASLRSIESDCASRHCDVGSTTTYHDASGKTLSSAVLRVWRWAIMPKTTNSVIVCGRTACREGSAWWGGEEVYAIVVFDMHLT